MDKRLKDPRQPIIEYLEGNEIIPVDVLRVQDFKAKTDNSIEQFLGGRFWYCCDGETVQMSDNKTLEMYFLRMDEDNKLERFNVKKENQDFILDKRTFSKNGMEFLEGVAPRKWLVRNWIPQGSSVVMIYGQSSSGKTYFMVDLMMTLISGRSSWFGNKAKTANVWYLCGESPNGVKERIKAWIMEKGGEEGSPEKEALNEGLVHRFQITDNIMALNKLEEIEKLKAEIIDSNVIPNLIIIDTLAVYLEGNENDSECAGAWMRNMRELASRFNCCVCFIHHTGKGEKDNARGSATFFNNADMVYQVNGENKPIITLSQNGIGFSAKVKEGRVADNINAQLEYVILDHDEEGEVWESSIIREAQMEDEEDKEATKRADKLLKAISSPGFNRFVAQAVNLEEGKYTFTAEALRTFITQDNFNGDGVENKKARDKAKQRKIEEWESIGLIKAICENAITKPEKWYLDTESNPTAFAGFPLLFNALKKQKEELDEETRKQEEEKAQEEKERQNRQEELPEF